VIEYTKIPVRSQKMGTVNIKLLTQNLFGKVSKEILVKTNDPQNPNFVLTLKAEIIQPETEGTKEVSTNADVSTVP
jgi:hypothetical protein